jgi:chromosome partitioning protein
MARVITVGSQKGGVGKTTTVLNLGYSLSRLSQRVLLVDADPQSGMSLATNLNRRVIPGLVQVMEGNLRPMAAVAYSRDRTLAGLNTGVIQPQDTLLFERECRGARLQEVLRELDEHFDYILLDAPAGVGSIVHGLLSVSNAVMLVVRCQTIGIKSLPVFLKTVQHARENGNPGLRLAGVLVTMRNPQDALGEQLCRELLDGLPAEAFFRVQIPFDPAFEAASQGAAPVARLKGAQIAAQAYMDLAVELRERDEIHRAGGPDGEDAEGLF